MMSPHLALLLVTLIYGLFYVAIKTIVSSISPWDAFIIRLLLATPLFFILEKLFWNTQITSKADLLKITGLGLLGVSIVQGTILVGMKYTTVFHAGFIVGTAPLLTLLFSILLKQEKFSWVKFGGALVAFWGLYLLLASRSAQQHLPDTYLWGDAIIFLNILGWSLFLILSRPLLQKYPAFSLTSYAFVLSSIVTLPFMLLMGGRIPNLMLSQTLWIWMGFVVIFATLITYFLNYYALARLPASVVAIYVFLQPLTTAIFAHFILNEPITLQMVLYGSLILLGVSIATGSYQLVSQWIHAKTTG